MRVAKVERKRPRRRREKDLRSTYCCGCGGYHLRVMTAKTIGKTALISVKPRAAEFRYYEEMLTSDAPVMTRGEGYILVVRYG